MRGILIAVAAMFCLAQVAFAAEEDGQAPAAQIDPARLAAASKTVDHVFPEGTYARMMKGSMDAIMGTVLDSVSAMPMEQIAGMAGMTHEDVADLGDGTLAQVMEIYDPSYRERMERTMRVTMEHMTGLMGKMEPDMRAGLARAYAARFDEAQLSELNGFFATPTGSLYAAQSMMIFLDPQVMDSMQKMVPMLMEEMPALQVAMEMAVADLPPPRSSCDLSADERARLAKLLGQRALANPDCEGE